jgi:hypothetical protein
MSDHSHVVHAPAMSVAGACLVCLKLTAGLLLAGLLPAADRPAPPRYEVRRAAAPIQIDGKPDEPTWAAAERIELIFPWESQTGPKQKTIVRLLWDDNFLYAAFECDDSDITAQFVNRDDPVDRDDSVMLLVNPKPSQTLAYIGLEMNVRAVLHDYLSASGGYFFQRFNLQGVRLATSIDGTLNQPGDRDRGWALELAIPWSNFDDLSRQHGAGIAWSANLARWDGLAPNRRLSIWSDPLLDKPSAHVAERFGQLVFVK